MKLRRKITALLLSVIILAGTLPVSVSAKSTKLIALTFDDGPSTYTPTLLDGLKERGAKVTFFMTGHNANNYPSLVKRAWQEGHQICMHSYNHELLTNLSDTQIKENLRKTNNALDKAIGYDLRYSLRPPYGGYSDRVLNAVGVPSYYWSVDTRDWESRNADAAYRQFMNAAKDGSIVLMHDIYSTTVTAALRAIDTLKSQGYEFVTVNELLVRRGITPTAGEIYFKAYPGSHGTDDTLKKPEISYKDTSDGKKVFISGDSRARIYYTTDGTQPTPTSCKRYSSPFSVKDGTKITAICVYDWNGFKTETVSKTVSYTQLSAPKISVKGSTMSFYGLPEGSSYYYTDDDSIPTSSSEKYTGSFTAKPDTVYTVTGSCPGYKGGECIRVCFGASGWLYTDCDTSCWYFAACDRAVGMKLITLKDRTLSANSELNRAELAELIYKAAGSPAVEEYVDLDDVPLGSAYSAAVSWAYNTGISLGCGEGLFMPDSTASREQLCAMLVRYLRSCGVDLSEYDPSAIGDFSDSDEAEPCLIEELGVMCALGIIRGYGDGTLCPKAPVTRAEAVTMLLRTLDFLDSL